MKPDELKAWASRLGLGEAGMAAYLGVPVPTYRKWEAGTRRPDSAPLRLFAVLDLVEKRAPELHGALIDVARGKDAPTPATKRAGKGKGATPRKNAPAAPESPALPAWMTGGAT